MVHRQQQELKSLKKAWLEHSLQKKKNEKKMKSRTFRYVIFKEESPK